MNQGKNIGLYIGLLLVLGGIVGFLDLNGLLPGDSFSQYINLIVGGAILIAYLKNRRFYMLMIASFFIFNGLLLLLDEWLMGWNYLCGVFLIPGLMFLVAFSVKKYFIYLVPGTFLTSWGIFVLLITTHILNGFFVIIGMGFLFTALSFLVIFFYNREIWLSIPLLIFGTIGFLILTLGLDYVTRLILFNFIAIAVILLGLVLIIRSIIKSKGRSDEEEE